MLECGKNLRVWGVDPNSPTQTYHDLIVRDMEIVKMVLLVTGSVDSTCKRQLSTRWMEDYGEVVIPHIVYFS